MFLHTLVTKGVLLPLLPYTLKHGGGSGILLSLTLSSASTVLEDVRGKLRARAEREREGEGSGSKISKARAERLSREYLHSLVSIVKGVEPSSDSPPKFLHFLRMQTLSCLTLPVFHHRGTFEKLKDKEELIQRGPLSLEEWSEVFGARSRSKKRAPALSRLLECASAEVSEPDTEEAKRLIQTLDDIGPSLSSAPPITLYLESAKLYELLPREHVKALAKVIEEMGGGNEKCKVLGKV